MYVPCIATILLASMMELLNLSLELGRRIDLFWVPKTLTFKTRLSAKPFLWKWVKHERRQSFSFQWFNPTYSVASLGMKQRLGATLINGLLSLWRRAWIWNGTCYPWKPHVLALSYQCRGDLFFCCIFNDRAGKWTKSVFLFWKCFIPEILNDLKKDWYIIKVKLTYINKIVRSFKGEMLSLCRWFLRLPVFW